jgi:general secretion pathway protein J
MHPAKIPNRPLSARSQAGLTLVELLVSMVILSFVMTLVSEAVYQVSQIARAADATTRGLGARWGAGWSASGVFANLLAPEEPSDKPPMVGSSTRVAGFTARPLSGGDTGIEPFELQLGPAQNNRPGDALTTDLIMTLPGDNRRAASTQVVASFPGRAEFAYVDRSGLTLPVWPPLTRNELAPEDLPRVVMVREAGSGQVLMWYGFLGETIRQTAPRAPFQASPQ